MARLSIWLSGGEIVTMRMRKRRETVVLLLLFILSCDLMMGRVEAFKGTVFQFDHEVVVESGVKVRWTTREPEWITFEISGETKGYIGIGFSHSGTMKESDLYIGWVDDRGNAHIMDYYANENGAPIEDHQQDLELLAASENEHGTMIIFRRKLDTCDHRDYVIGDDTVFLLWAWGPDDPKPGKSGRDNDFQLTYHGSNEQSRGSRAIRMTSKQVKWKFPDEEEKYPLGVMQYDFTNTNVQVPKADSYHHCRIIKFPQLQERNTLFAYKLITTPESGDREHQHQYIHRISLHKCFVPDYVGESEDSVLEKYVDLPGWNCYGPEYPFDLQAFCSQTTIAVLGRGYEQFKFPDHVGMEIGELGGASYYRLEIHYQNPEGLFVIDNSGIRVFYSSNPREYEAGIMVTGHRRSPFMTIPPQQAEFNIYGLCSAECMWNGLNPEGTKIFGVHMHTHWSGRRAKLKHIRNGREIPPIMVDNHLRQNHQDYRLLPREVNIIPGDQLVLQCTYETIGNDTITFGGLSGAEEVCEATLIYYPKSRLTDCRSQPELYQYLGAIGVMNATGETFRKLNVSYSPDGFQDYIVTPVDDAYVLEGEGNQPPFNDVLITSPAKLKNRYLYDFMTRLNWGDDFFSKIVEQKWKTGLHYMHCIGNGRKKIPTSSHVVPYPIYEDFAFPAQQPDKCFGWGMRSEGTVTSTLSIFLLVIRLLLFYGAINVIS